MALASRIPTAPIAAGGLIAGFAVATGTGSRPLGGVVLAAAGLSCIGVWRARDGGRTTAALTAAGLGAFALSHVLGPRIGAWPAVLVVSAATAGLCWQLSDRRRPGRQISAVREAGSPRTPRPADQPEASV
jgi:hypothetical protein